MGRGKDKRTIENLKVFHDKINYFIHHEKLSFVKIDDVYTDYIISSKGVLYRIDNKNNSILFVRPYMEKDGHLRVGLRINGKNRKKYIHQLVAEAFVPNPENKQQVHHKDGDELNNDYDNLIWVTDKEHKELTKLLNQYIGIKGSSNSSSKYSDEQIERTLKLIEENDLYPDEICNETGISYSTFQHLLHRPESWDYIKCNYDISKYDKFRRLTYTDDQKERFKELRKTHPEFTLKIISNMMGIRYETIKNWNRLYI